jgi:uncharacterized protein (DUF2141 family)
MTRIISFCSLLFLGYLFVSSCASPSSPTGGPKDTIPPNLISSVPVNQSLNYEKRTFTLEFDERIKTEKLKEQLIITPLTESDYDYVVKKNTFKITFEDPFLENTTYTLNFRESIQDITEGNPTEDNKFTFSTGDYIDSMSVSGYVKDLLTYDTLENVTVGLYRAEDTVTIFNGSPYYFTETDETGQFIIENIKNGPYLIYAFVDDNKNLTLETNNENYAFLKDTIFLDSATYDFSLDLVSLDLSELKVMTSLSSGQYYEINFNKFLADYDIAPLNNDHTFFTSTSKQGKSIRFYNSFTDVDSLAATIQASDSIGATVLDTVYVKFTESRRQPDELNFKVLPEKGTPVETEFYVDIAFNKPIVHHQTDSIYLRYDTTMIAQVADSSFIWGKHRDKVSFQVVFDPILIDTIQAKKRRMEESLKDSVKSLQTESKKQQIGSESKKESKVPNKGLQLYFGNASFISIENDTSSATGISYQIIQPSEFGKQKIDVLSNYDGYFIQLLKTNYEIVQEVQDQNAFTFDLVPPGKYLIRVLIDANNDGVWSPGNMRKQIEPEPVYIYPETIVIRADWETSLTLQF